MRMAPIKVVTGDATNPEGPGNKIIAHICNDIGGWGKGFVLAVSRRWAEPEQDYRKWYQGRANNDFELGAVRLVQVKDELWVANMVGQRDIVGGPSGPPIRYEVLERCLRTLGDSALQLNASVHMPRIGCGLAGGRWEKIEPLIVGALSQRQIAVTVYDLPQ